MILSDVVNVYRSIELVDGCLRVKLLIFFVNVDDEIHLDKDTPPLILLHLHSSNHF